MRTANSYSSRPIPSPLRAIAAIFMIILFTVGSFVAYRGIKNRLYFNVDDAKIVGSTIVPAKIIERGSHRYLIVDLSEFSKLPDSKEEPTVEPESTEPSQSSEPQVEALPRDNVNNGIPNTGTN